MKRLLAVVSFLALAAHAFAQSSEVANADPAVEKRLKGLAEELRCLVCQNQTIADSNAPLALDLRNQIRGQVAQGRSDDEIRRYMVDRYGDFVLYRPPFKVTTVVLWLGPLLLILGGIAAFVVIVRRRSPHPPPEVAVQRRAQIESLLEGDRPAAPPSQEPPKRRR